MNKRRGQQRYSNRGLTLFEVMIAIALFAIIVTPIMRTFVTSIRVNQQSRKVMIATDIAQSIIEGYTGKTYADVWKGMNSCGSAFNFQPDGNGKFAFTTINNGFYNDGNTYEINTFPAALAAQIPATLSVTDLSEGYDKKIVNALGVPYDKLISLEAANKIRANVASEAPILPWDATTGVETYQTIPKGDPTYKASSDKALLWGCYDAKRYVENSYYEDDGGAPLFSYMVYSRIQKDNYFFDAVVTFVPQAQNLTKKSGVKVLDTYFNFKVSVTVYEYTYDDYNKDTGEWPSRFDEHGYFEGTPLARMETGIQNK